MKKHIIEVPDVEAVGVYAIHNKKNDKYCLSNHCLILSKNGYPYKIAVAEVKEGQRILGLSLIHI